ncbi:MAG: IS4 family transposase [Colwellia sp.]
MKLLSNLFTLDSNTLDTRIVKSLFNAANSLINGSVLTLTSMGRDAAILNNISEKQSIKRVDRLLGNEKLHQKRHCYYQIISRLFLATNQPLIHVDWSTVYNFNFVMLRASISIGGRAVTVYEEVHPEEKHMNQKVQTNFLANLKNILPEKTQPIICTDAGFKIPWFKVVESLNWFWLARTRGTVKCQLQGEGDWCYVSECHKMALLIASELKEVKLSKSHRFACRGILFRGKNKQRHKVNRKGITTKCNTNKKHAKSGKEPWFLVSNLPKNRFKPHQLVNLYKRRMSIEESFRDCKNEYYGLGLSRSLSRCLERLQIILLLSMMVQFYLYCVGKSAETAGYHLEFQANTIKHKRVLSYGFLALRILQHKRYHLSDEMIISAMETLIHDSLY